MGMHAEICYMLEALTYFGMKANHISFEQRMNRALLNCENSEEAKFFIEASRLTYSRLDSLVQADEASLKAFFGFFEGMPEGHPLGYNIANLLCSLVANTRMSYEEQKEMIKKSDRSMTTDAALFALTILNRKIQDGFDFFDAISSLPLTQEDKLRVLSACTHPEEYLEKIFALLDLAVTALRSVEGELMPILNKYCEKYGVQHVTEKLNRESGFVLPEDAVIDVLPYLLNPGMLTVYDEEGEHFTLHIGMLYMLRFAGKGRLTENEMIETLKSISDSSRLEILRCLGDGEMYGREIAKKVGLYSTTISHHMAKLINSRIVRCRLAGNKAFYSIDAEGAKAFMNSLADLLKTKPE